MSDNDEGLTICCRWCEKEYKHERKHIGKTFRCDRCSEPISPPKNVPKGGTPAETIQVHTIGRPGLDYEDDYDIGWSSWMMSGGGTYQIKTWTIGIDVSKDLVARCRDPSTGALYVFYRIVDGNWVAGFVPEWKFSLMKGVEDRR